MEEKNAIITSVSLGVENHNVLSMYLYLDYGGAGQAFGGWTLYLPKGFKHHGGANYAGHFIARCLEIAGVEKFEDMGGKTIRVKGTHSKAVEIGHIVKDDWFNPEEEFKVLEDNLKKMIEE